ncbi:sodium-coupled monocarboxylate transporter 1-like [Bacillus rossius redtenbacheri]|uniref:sodium-coupled monocarboxylate transporter 1-like n=1 Tax=Bacillus rossius redtenbacheri TaxID=93214 RepID=UPI002FDDEF27
MWNTTGAEPLYFGWLDHCVFGFMLLLSTIIGMVIACLGKQDTKLDYLLGGKTMSTFPIAMSLIFSHVSGISLMGVPSEIYTYGTQYYIVNLAIIITGVLNYYIYLPVFFDLQLTSTYEYLELRFNQHVRVMASLLFTISVILYIPIVIYVPALAFNQVTGINLHFITPIVCMVCILYTMLGGIKAVVWTDFLQSFVTMGSVFAVIVIGLIDVGGFSVVWERNKQGGRLELFNMDPSLLARNTFWTVTLGSTFGSLSSLCVNQGMVQKFIALPDFRRARSSLVIFTVGMTIVKTIVVFVGLIMFAAYYDCDPFTTKKILKADQIVPYYVMDTSADLPGLPGLFVAGIFSAALSTMSSNLNCLSGTIYEDFILPFIRGNKVWEDRAHIIMKIIVFLFGLLCIVMVFIVEQMGGVYQLSVSLSGVTVGVFLGLFTLGMFFPWANFKGALAGTVVGLLFMGWMVFGAQHTNAIGIDTFPYLPLSTEGCETNATFTTTPWSPMSTPHPRYEDSQSEEVFLLYRVSYMLYSVVGTLVVLVVGMVVSWATGFTDTRHLDPRLIVPIMKRFAGPPVRPHEKQKLYAGPV